MTTLEIIELVAIAVAVAGFLIWFIVNAIKNKWISKLYETITAAIKEAEKSGKSGVDKKAFVLQKVEDKCNELGIPYKLLSNLISKLIDTIIKHYNVIKK